MTFKLARRLEELPPYLFSELDRAREEAQARGVDIIDLGVGDPDRPTPVHIVDALEGAARRPANHRYPLYYGHGDFRRAVAGWYGRRHGVRLAMENVVTLIGSKEGIAHFPLAFVNPGDVVLAPEPAYPIYEAGTVFCGGRVHFMPLKEENGFLPDFKAVDGEILKRARIIWVNYPHNPTGASASLAFYGELVEWARKWNLIVAADAAYSEITAAGEPHPSILEAPGALDVAIEFNSLSKTYNMTGWRLGWAAGNESLVQGLGLVKKNIDSGAFQAVQDAGLAALEGDQGPVREMGLMYQARRAILEKGLARAGLKVFPSQAGFYVWAKLPGGLRSGDFCRRLLAETGIVAIPGLGFGPSGEGYARFSLTCESGRVEEAAARLAVFRL